MCKAALKCLSITFILTLIAINAWAQTTSVTLAWAPNTEPDLAGYYLYYKTGSCGEPYDGTGAFEGNSPVRIPLSQFSDPNNPQFTLTQLNENEVYYFVLTAYDNEDPENESEYSNWVSNARYNLAVDFGPNGLWNYDDSSWNKIASWNPEDSLTSWAGGVVSNFNSEGLWNYDYYWNRLSAWNSSDIEARGDELAGDFDANGLWSYNGSEWTRISNWNPSGITGWGGGNLAGDFEAYGLWNYNGNSWARISTLNPSGMADWGENNLAVDFGSYGIWNYNGTALTMISSWTPSSMIGWANSHLVVDFNENGIWTYNGSVWTKISDWDPSQIIA